MNESKKLPFKLALNTSTLIPFNLNVKQQVSIAAQAGYAGIELWVRDIVEYIDNGGTLKELRKYVCDTGISVVNAIAFFKWTDASEELREEGFEQAEREMHMLAEIGCIGVAAPPYGNVDTVTLDDMAHNFAKLTETARKIGVEPYLEFWGMAKKLSRISEAVYIVIESGVSDAKILLDPFHMYKGGSSVESLEFIDGKCIGIVHVNDYPAEPPREIITDNERVFPGDGTAPSGKIAQLLDNAGYNEYLSLELFRQTYGSKSALEVASEGLEKIKKSYSI